MSIVQSTAQFISGLQNVERAIITKVREAGGTITARNFKWNHGRNFVPPPRDAIDVEVATLGKIFKARLSYEQVLDSSRRIERPDVIAGVLNAVIALTG